MLELSLKNAFINHFQGGFPITERPFLEVAESLGCEEQDIIDLLQTLLADGSLTRFGPLFDSAQLGGGLTLAALQVPAQRFEEITELVNSFPQVAHNYQRDHRFNMWFVIATEHADQIDSVIEKIELRSGLKVYNCPKRKEFYIGLKLHIEQDGHIRTVAMDASWMRDTVTSIHKPDDLDRQLILHTQQGLPLLKRPYDHLAEQLGISSELVMQRLQGMMETGVIRRIGAVPNHYRLGLSANGMTVWDVTDDEADALGRIFGTLDFVSHCYLRPRHRPDWPYNLFAMVHGNTRESVLDKVHQMEQMTSTRITHEVLFSTAILKKTGLRLAA